MHSLIKASLLLVFPLIAACSSETMPNYSVVQGLRVLGLNLDYPEVNFDGTTFSTPGATTLVQVTPVVSDLYGAGRSLNYNLYHCVDPGVGLGAVPTCAGNPTRVSVQSAQSVAATADFLSPNYTGTLSPVTLDLAAGTLGATISGLYSAKYASLTSIQKFNGFSILIFFELYPTSDESKKITTFKRLIVSGPMKTVKNANPSTLNFINNGVNLNLTQALPTLESSVDAFVPASDFETYSALDSSGNPTVLTESIETAWFLTGPEDIKCSKKKDCTPDGLFTLSRTVPGELNLFHPPEVSLPSGRGRVLIGIAKDNRGGSKVTRICDGALCP